MKKDISRKLTFFLIAAILFYFIYSNFLAGTNYSPYDNRWYPCIKHVEQGTIYKNILHCEQGIFVYFIPYLFYETVGKNFQLTLFLIKLTNLLLLAAIYFLSLKIFSKYSDRKDIFTLVFLLMFVNANLKFDMTLSIFFFLLGVIFFKKEDSSFLDILFSSMFFGFSINSKFSSIIPTILFLAFEIIDFNKIIRHKRFFFNKETIIKASLVNSVVAVQYLVLLTIYPQYLLYTLQVHYEINVQSFLSTLINYVNLNSVLSLLSIIVLLLCFYSFFLKKDIFSFLGSFGLFIISIAILKSFGGSFSILSSYYSVPLLFSAISLSILFTKHEKLYFLFSAIFITIIILNSVQGSQNWADTCERMRLVEKPLSFIETKGKILMTGDKQYINFLVSCLQLEKQKDKIINIENLQGFGELTDPGYGKNLLAHLGDNVDTKVPMVDTETYEKLMSAIKIGEITVVIESPPEWALTHEIAVNYNFNHAFVLASNAFTRGVGRHNQIIYFSDYNEALAFANKTATYYIKNYYSICENSLYDGQIVAYAYALGNTSFRLRCPNQNDTTQKIRLY